MAPPASTALLISRSLVAFPSSSSSSTSTSTTSSSSTSTSSTSADSDLPSNPPAPISSCCIRCIMRFCGLYDPVVFAAPWKECVATMESHFKLSPADPSPLKDHDDSLVTCPACLGLLQLIDDSNTVELIAAEVRKEDHEADDFVFTVSMPTAVLVRHHATWLYLAGIMLQHGDNFYKGRTPLDYPEAKEIFRKVIGKELSSKLEKPVDPQSAFTVLAQVVHPESEQDFQFLTQISEADFQIRKVREKGQIKLVGDNNNQVSAALKRVPAEKFRKYGTCPPKRIALKCEIQVNCELAAVYVAGRYLKYTRGLSHTPWILHGVRKSESSVEERISGLLKSALRASDSSFTSAGREDVDVRMLGRGRPFVVEIINAHRVKFTREEMRQLQSQINSSNQDVAVRHLQIVPKEKVLQLKEGEETKKKTYSCIVWLSREVTPEVLEIIASKEKLTLFQNTPVRVLHRRVASVREKLVEKMSAEKINSHFLKLVLTAQAGTYIKEFVHGDLGRTTPNLGQLLNCEADIIQLDVEDVDLDWPPPIAEDL